MKTSFILIILIIFLTTTSSGQILSDYNTVELNTKRVVKLFDIELNSNMFKMAFIIRNSRNITGYIVEIKEENKLDFWVLDFIPAQSNSCHPVEYSFEKFVKSKNKIEVIKLSEVRMGYQKTELIATIYLN